MKILSLAALAAMALLSSQPVKAADPACCARVRRREPRCADFTWAKLGRITFEFARLNGAIFRDADLTHADFSGAYLTGADFTGAKFDHTNFDSAVVKDTKGLPPTQ